MEKPSIDLWQMGKEFSKLGSEKLANLLISAGERSEPLRRALYVWSAFIMFKKDQVLLNLEKKLIHALSINDFIPYDEADSFDLVIYELQDFLNEQFKIQEQRHEDIKAKVINSQSTFPPPLRPDLVNDGPKFPRGEYMIALFF